MFLSISGYLARKLNISQLPIEIMSVQDNLRYLMNQNQIWYNLITGMHQKLDPNKLSGFMGISQVAWFDTGKKHALFMSNEFAD
jgi:hypothetical protein